MAVGQVYYKVLFAGKSAPESSINEAALFGETANVVRTVGQSRFIKIGIQAPPGTKAVINETQTIMIGRNGLYELEADITSLRLIPIQIYETTEGAGESAALSQLQQIVNTLSAGLAGSNKKEAIATFNSKYPNAVAQYLNAITGYETPVSTKAAENVIIDYEY